MLSTTHIEKRPAGWFVQAFWGRATVTHGPYRWRWMARVMAWLEAGQH